MRLHLLFLAASITMPSVAIASSVQEMAAERVKEKMGTIRGTIAPADTNVRLTVELIDRWRPIASVPEVAERRELPSDPGYKIGAEPVAAQLPNDSDMRSIMQAVDAMIANGPDS
ncbi:hypothetical protein [Ahrensia sp. R2A130]|uniref:hypothetical protein n=1 Tax=Ahrensia sp. R2A130 TaxID=744979 RepID=UPI0001E0D109|nr:hypothetical protein [Ahrensia sp. R2A130]EFL88854.1 hypothetical protein R2A130_1339 [Ahrensia sp. R2A130]